MKIIPKPKTGEYVPYSGANNRELEAILEELYLCEERPYRSLVALMKRR